MEEHQDRSEVKVAGIVTKMRDGTTRRGNKYGVFTIEDFSGSAEFACLVKSMPSSEGYLGLNSMLFMSGGYQSSFRDPTAKEFKIRDMKFLESAFNDICKKLELKIRLEDISPEFIDKLEKMFKEHEGEKLLEFQIMDDGMKVPLKLSSRTWRVRPNNELIKELETIQVGYALK